MTNEEAADALKRLIYPTHAPYHNEVIRLAIAALRTPPATGAAAMREAEKVCSDVYDGYMVAAGRANTEARYDDEKDEMLKADGALRCLSKVRPLPAPEVPDKYAAFGKAVWLALSDRIGHGEMDETDADNAELAVKAGLAEHVHYDPEKHGEVQDAAPGDKIVWWGGL